MSAVVLCDDPHVLQAALALVDEYYATDNELPVASNNGNPTVEDPASVSHSSPRPLTCRAPQLHPQQRNGHVRKTSTTNGSARAQARRLSKLIRQWQQLQSAAHMKYAPPPLIATAQPLECEHVATIRSQLTTLAEIARVSRMKAPAGLHSTFLDASARLRPSGDSLVAQFQSSFYLPFKFSHVVDAAWEDLVSRILGDRSPHQLSVVAEHEGFSVALTLPTSSSTRGIINSTVALRRVYDDDGSVLLLFSSAASMPTAPPSGHPSMPPPPGPPSSHPSMPPPGPGPPSGYSSMPPPPGPSGGYSSMPPPGPPGDPPFPPGNPLAGCLVKGALWIRLRHVPPPANNGAQSNRHLVIMEIAQSCLVTSSSPDRVVPTEQLEMFRHLLLASTTENHPGNRVAMENRLMDMSLASP